MAEEKTILEKLQEDFKFKITDDPQHKNIKHFDFEDGRSYRFQKPGFMTRFTEIMDSLQPRTATFKLGMRITIRNLEKAPQTPELTEAYMDEHESEAWDLWFLLFRELL